MVNRVVFEPILFRVALSLVLALSVSFSFVTCIDSEHVAQQNNQENFQRAFESQLELIENQNVGCLFDKDVCLPEDNCFNDGLFGTCIAAYADEAAFTYRIPARLLGDLKAILATLVAQNFTWHDRFTQCCVRAALICGSMEIATDLSVCRVFAAEDRSPPKTKTLTQSTKTKTKIHGLRQNLLQTIRQRDQQAKRFDRDQELEELNRQRLEQLLGMPEKKLQELLHRHKYEYALQDTPEKKSEEEEETAHREAIWNEIMQILDWEQRIELERLMDQRPGAQQESRETLPGAREQTNSDTAADPDVILPPEEWLPPSSSEQPPSQPKNWFRTRVLGSAAKYVPRSGPKFEPSSGPKFEPSSGPKFEPSSAQGVESLAVQLRKRQTDPAFIDGSYLWVQFRKPSTFAHSAAVPRFIERFNQVAGRRLLGDSYSVNMTKNEVYFQLAPMAKPGDVKQLFENKTTASELKAGGQFAWEIYGFGRPQNRVEASELNGAEWSQRSQLTSTLLVCGLVLAMIAALFVVFAVQRFRTSKQKLRDLTASSAAGGSADYRDLCRQRMLDKSAEQREPLSAAAQQIASARPAASDSPNSSTGSWSDDPIATDMDITTGHLILSYMEEYLSNKEKLEQEWASLCTYEADQTSSAIAATDENAAKNRYPDLLPYDHSRVALRKDQNATGGDYINASFISDSDPKVKSYILTQGPTDATAADFWQMLWECCSITVVNLTKLNSPDGSQELCSQYWPSEGSRLFNRFEVHLVSEHIWCESFVVRNFYLKNLATGEARTVTMFHFLSWDEAGLPPSAKALLDFRRKVNKSYKGRTSPLVIQCNDGCGRSGAYCLLDLALSRINKGVKEIDLAACLEHLRDQRPGLVRSMEQFEFVVTAIAEEVHNVLKTLPQ